LIASQVAQQIGGLAEDAPALAAAEQQRQPVQQADAIPPLANVDEDLETDDGPMVIQAHVQLAKIPRKALFNYSLMS